MRFYTGLTVLQGHGGFERHALSRIEVQYRVLSEALIEDYLRRDQPYDCAGSARIESLGVALVSAVRSEDPTALIGLPLIVLTGFLSEAGLPPLGAC
jgi:septum formation protein